MLILKGQNLGIFEVKGVSKKTGEPYKFNNVQILTNDKYGKKQIIEVQFNDDLKDYFEANINEEIEIEVSVSGYFKAI